ncbi:hypothetical protein Dsin_028930 [Dipteronia sinensis]|uniref:DUF4283 domain-containing protein n=1 Tax=Dipteronia sinensis TaxID=43782 RepID=A0AAE0DV23_9ROSI|nr:hypothetical protein Dsin_028930 [Dipteronia sinensis]
MVDSSPSMDPSPKHPSLPCLGSKRLSTPYSLVLPPGSTMENPPFPEAPSFSTSSVLPPTPSLQDRPLPSPHIVSSAGVSSILNANDSIECSNGSTKRGHGSTIPKLVLNNAFNQARTGHSTLNRAVVAEAKGVLSSCPLTSTIAAILGNNGGLEVSGFAAHLKNELGKMKGFMDQCNRFEKSNRSEKSAGMVEKLASKGEDCPAAIVEDQKVQLEEVSSLSNYVLPHKKGISITPPLVNKDASNAIGQVPPIISEKSPISYSNVLKGAHNNPLMDPPSVNNIALRIWGNHGLLEVLANEKGSYFFKFSDDEACSNVLEAGPWLFAGRMVILKKWHPRLILSKDSYSKIPVWVKLFNIPHEYWNEEGLSHIASAVALVEEGDNRNDKCNYQSNDQCNDVDPPSMASPDQRNDQWLSSPMESSSKKKKKKHTAKKGKVNSSQAKFRISFVYGSNDDRLRKALWQSICSSQHGSPWIVLGDFNVSRSVGESIGGCSRISGAMEEFNDCLQSLELDDLRFSSFLHTWCNKRSNGCISKKLDRVLVNNDWLVKFENSEAIFLPPSISDHCPSVVKLGLQSIKKNAISKFSIF